jgi:hypothetical protein
MVSKPGEITRLRSDHGMRPYILRAAAARPRSVAEPVGSSPSSE